MHCLQSVEEKGLSGCACDSFISPIDGIYSAKEQITPQSASVAKTMNLSVSNCLWVKPQCPLP